MKWLGYCKVGHNSDYYLRHRENGTVYLSGLIAGVPIRLGKICMANALKILTYKVFLLTGW
jgi:hypothetical protein